MSYIHQPSPLPDPHAIPDKSQPSSQCVVPKNSENTANNITPPNSANEISNPENFRNANLSIRQSQCLPVANSNIPFQPNSSSINIPFVSNCSNISYNFVQSTANNPNFAGGRPISQPNFQNLQFAPSFLQQQQQKNVPSSEIGIIPPNNQNAQIQNSGVNQISMPIPGNTVMNGIPKPLDSIPRFPPPNLPINPGNELNPIGTDASIRRIADVNPVIESSKPPPIPLQVNNPSPNSPLRRTTDINMTPQQQQLLRQQMIRQQQQAYLLQQQQLREQQVQRFKQQQQQQQFLNNQQQDIAAMQIQMQQEVKEPIKLDMNLRSRSQTQFTGIPQQQQQQWKVPPQIIQQIQMLQQQGKYPKNYTPEQIYFMQLRQQQQKMQMENHGNPIAYQQSRSRHLSNVGNSSIIREKSLPNMLGCVNNNTQNPNYDKPNPSGPRNRFNSTKAHNAVNENRPNIPNIPNRPNIPNIPNRQNNSNHVNLKNVHKSMSLYKSQVHPGELILQNDQDESSGTEASGRVGLYTIPTLNLNQNYEHDNDNILSGRSLFGTSRNNESAEGTARFGGLSDEDEEEVSEVTEGSENSSNYYAKEMQYLIEKEYNKFNKGSTQTSNQKSNEPENNSNPQSVSTMKLNETTLTKDQVRPDEFIINENINQKIMDSLSPKLDQSNIIRVDQKIDMFLMQKRKENNLNLFGNYVLSCEDGDNPYYDKSINDFVQKIPASSKDSVIRFFSEKCKIFTLQAIKEEIPPQILKKPDRIPFLSNDKEHKKITRIRNDLKIHPSIDCFIRMTSELNSFFDIPETTLTPLQQYRVLTIKLEKFEIHADTVEPLFFCGFIVSSGEIVSEPWYFCHHENIKQFLPYIHINNQAAFRIPTELGDASFVVLISRCVLPENGANINNYYLKPTQKRKVFALDQAKCWIKYPNIYAPLAYTFCDLDAMAKSPVLMPLPFALNGVLRNVIKNLKASSGNVYPFNITFSTSISNGNTHIHELKEKNDCVVNILALKSEIPINIFRHKMYFQLSSFNLNVKNRNLYAYISFRKGDEDLPLIYSPYQHSMVKRLGSKCYYHEKRPYFDDWYLINLPYKITPDLSIFIWIYNATLKNIGINENIKEDIGFCKIPLIQNGEIISNGPHSIPITYKNPVSIQQNAVVISTYIDSALISTDPCLNKFYAKISSVEMEKSRKNDLVANLFLILDKLVLGLCSDPYESVKSMVILSNKVQEAIDFEKAAKDYVMYYAYRTQDTTKIESHRNLLRYWARFIENEMKTRDQVRTDLLVMNPFFMLIIKSIYLTKDKEFNDEFTGFIIQWSKAFQEGQVSVYSRFINLLFDIGYYSLAIQAITTQVAFILEHKLPSQVLIEFLAEVLRPKLFYASIMYSDHFTALMLDMIGLTLQNTIFLDKLYAILLKLIAQYSESMRQEISGRFITCLSKLSNLKSMKLNSEYHPFLAFYTFLLNSMTFESFEQWFKNLSSFDEMSSFFESLHFLISFIKDHETARTVHYVVLNVLTHLVQINNEKSIELISKVFYHFLCVDVAIDFVPPLLGLFETLVSRRYDYLIVRSTPVITKHIIKILELSYLNDCVSNFCRTFVNVDQKIFSNNRRSMAVFCRALLMVKNIQEVDIAKDLPFYQIVVFLKECDRVMGLSINDERRTELLYQKAMMVIHSPDASIEVLCQLADFHKENEYYAEELQTLLLISAITLEYLSSQGRVSIDYFHIDRGALLFEDICPMAKRFRCSEDAIFRIPSYCDSPSFSEHSLICNLLHIMKRSRDNGYYEIGYYIMDKLWPLLEHHRNYILLVPVFKEYATIYHKIKEVSNSDRLFGKYFRVSLFGNVFNMNNAKTFIYREKKLTHLFELTNKLVEHYSKLFSPTPIELIKEAGQIDVSTLDPKKGYIQITFVEPTFMKEEQHNRKTLFEQNHNIKTFFFDTPFTKDGDKAQGSIESQWIRRTILTVQDEMPSLVKRVPVINVVEKEYFPLRVAYRQLRDRITQLRNAICQRDYRAIQQLLHGSLLVQVNEGATKMAEVFLKPGYEKTKYTEKLINAFVAFQKVNQQGLKIHGKWVHDNPMFTPLHQELESGLTGLIEKLALYLNN
ncbi:hypothetical protein TRFO_13553 [Tritrichomonas foetus]|uniref:DOCK family protein n=1 Tax=Tritrichomonas foetus TaxID=1144522 RepID=A0A1J4KXZ4_9EUKA|nr:hypothetical protein TRFO_13553 [Tritrichomonas foetus]|eukprot:OHT16050.1 hypothetical protein TRFO_13553 [Tritrichomonas foetus]